jgi:spermidine synthase
VAHITISEEHGVRYLHFGSRWVQGAMRIARPAALELEYTRDLMLPMLFAPEPEWPASVLQIGLGSASVTKFLHRHRPASHITAIEILPEVVAAARQYFKLPDDPDRVRIEIGDGHDFVARHRGKFDFVVVDGFDDKGRPGMLDTLPFHLNCRERLARGGYVTINLLTRHRGAGPSVERIRAAYGDRVLVIPPSEAGNCVAVASIGRPLRLGFEELRESARRLKEATGLNLLPTLARLATAYPGGHLAF